MALPRAVPSLALVLLAVGCGSHPAEPLRPRVEDAPRATPEPAAPAEPPRVDPPAAPPAPPPPAAVAGGSAQPRAARDGAARIAWSALPPEARETIARIKKGGPYPYRKDGSAFGNRERHLPPRKAGFYREYTVPTPGAKDRGARRIVASRDGAFFYSPDHYRSLARVEGMP